MWFWEIQNDDGSTAKREDGSCVGIGIGSLFKWVAVLSGWACWQWYLLPKPKMNQNKTFVYNLNSNKNGEQG